MDYKAQCLEAITATVTREAQVEIIVVDDASQDGTVALVRKRQHFESRLKLVSNEKNLGFIGACNRGAAAATGDILIFLNNDTLPRPGWLTALLQTFSDYPDAGAVGGKLIYPDGRLQEAGGVIFSDGSGANFGRGDQKPNRPLYNYVREVDYCSGALLATPRVLFQKLGGFDSHFAPAYYEDTDYCFRVRQSGLRVLYQPASSVIHLEGISSGTDLASGVKRYQVMNREKFLNRWRKSLSSQPAPPGRFDLETWHYLADRAYEPGGVNND
jgi:GT2 family glycosyltransferase